MSNYSQRSSSWKKIIATPLAVSFLVAGGGAAVPQLLTAAAAQGTTTTPGGLPAIDTNRLVSLTLHKLLNPSALGDPATGQDQTVTGPVYLNGVTFNATLLDTSNMNQVVDGKTFSQLMPAEVANLTAGQYMAYGATKTATIVSGETANGKPLTLTGMPQGVYLVEEVVPPNTVLTASDGQSYKSSTVKATAPFIVSLPMPNPQKTDWNYDVVVYPKNSAFKTQKTVTDLGVQSGQSLEYVLENEIPKPTTSSTDQIDVFAFEDIFDTAFIDVNGVTVDKVEIRDAAGAVIGTLDPADYTTAVQGGNKFRLELTNSGLTNILLQPVGAKVTATLKAPLVDGQVFSKLTLSNTFTSSVKFLSDINPIENTSNTVESKYVNLTVHKFATGTSDALAGATFELWQCTADAVPQPIGSRITVNNQASWTTDIAGNVVIAGLQVEDWANNAPRSDFHYCLKETQAPAGFVQLTNLIPVSAKSTDADTNPITSAIDLVANVDNQVKSTPNLPLTGGQGIALLVAIGAGLVGLAAWVARRNSKKTSH